MNKKITEIFSYIIIIIVVLLIKRFIITPVKVNGGSMNDTLKNKDIMILDRISYRFSPIKRFDIIVIKTDNEKIIKRVIGLPGDILEYKDNVLYVNNEVVKEDFNHKKIEDLILKEKIPEDYYFVLGDNRPISVDSRYIGLINKKDILGKTSLIIFPFKRIGVKK